VGWCEEHPEYPDSEARSGSATATLAIHAPALADLVESLQPAAGRYETLLKSNQKAGLKCGEQRRKEADERHVEIIKEARRLLKYRDRRSIAGLLAGKFKLTPHHIRRILKKRT
jgi:hypothetical protein